MVRRKHKTNLNVADLKDEKGLWIKSYVLDEEYNQTRSAGLWHSLQKRAVAGGYEQICTPSYLGCTHTFSDYQEFTTWCQEQYGYMNRESSGVYWALDKDPIVPGNKVYGPDTCCFLPAAINGTLTYTSPGAANKEFRYPIGTYLHGRNGNMVAYIHRSGKGIYLGSSYDPFGGTQALAKS